jgi:RNA polymerase sigma factor (sigma-70 family)
MQTADDIELLREYARHHSEEAFATLVSRHINLVYSAALRYTANHHQAEEITQAVFIILARKAGSLRPGTVLPGWLFHTTRLTARNYLRSENRRARREQEAFMETKSDERFDSRWGDVAPLLDDAIAHLGQRDRDAIVLRFLQGKDYKAVAGATGGTAEAAQMRVSRALEKLRKLFAKRGVTLSAAALAGLMAAHGAHAAPMGLASSITAGAIHGANLAASTLTAVKGTLKLMAWTKLKFSVAAGLVLMLAYQYRQNSIQAQQFAAARQDLQSATDAVAEQESRIAELRLQTDAIVQTRNEQEQELVSLRARRKTAANGTQPKAVMGASTTLLAAALQDPLTREMLRREFIGSAQNRWQPLVKELKLSSDAAQKMFNIGADWAMKNTEAVAAFTERKLSPEAAVQAGEQAEQEAQNQVRELLGDENMASFAQCNSNFPARTLGAQFDRQLGFFALADDQRQKLREVLEAEPNDVMAGLAGDFTVRELVLPEEMDQRLGRQKEVNQDILQQASQFLSPEQVEALSIMQESNLSIQRRGILRCLRTLRIDPMAPPVL